MTLIYDLIMKHAGMKHTGMKHAGLWFFCKKHFLFQSAALLFLSSPALADCTFNSSHYLKELSNLESIEKIDVNFSKREKWMRQEFKLLQIRGKDESINSKYKKKFNATLTVTYPFGVCDYPAKIKHNGDWFDHISLVKGTPYSSLDVELKQGNLAHLTKFKFFLPKTRNRSGEVVFTELLKELGYIAPTTRFIPVSQLGQSGVMLVQAKISKEMLEKNNRRENAFFEGNEIFYWDYRGTGRRHGNEHLKPYKISLTRLVNAKWAKQGNQSVASLVKAFDLLQLNYIQKTKLLVSFIVFSSITHDTSSPFLIQKPIQYDILLALHGSHALIYHNQKFYLNSFIDNHLESVYYDGGIEFTIPESRRHPYLDKRIPFRISADIDDLIMKIDDIIASGFADRVGKLLILDGKDHRYVSDALHHIRRNLVSERKHAKNTERPDIPKLDARKLKNIYKKNLFASLSDAQTAELVSIDYGNSLFETELCGITECQLENLSRDAFVEILQGKFSEDEPAIMYIGSRLISVEKMTTSFIEPLNLTLTHSLNARVVYQPEKKTLQLIQSRYDDWFLIKNTTLDDMTIELKGISPDQLQIEQIEKLQRFNEYGLTGCLTFYGTVFQNTQLSASNGGCEDSINILNSRGKIKNITIMNAYADALDSDFSTLTFLQSTISGAGNDCMDFSAGNYQITIARLQDCGDKAVSIGEASTFNADSLNIENVPVAVASKDSSTAFIKDIRAKNSKTCLEAYSKKQEFHGAILRIETIDCDGSHSFDKNSQIIGLES